MGKKKRKKMDKAIPAAPVNPVHLGLTVQLTVVYVFMVGGIVWLTLKYDAALYHDEMFRRPTHWLYTILAMYYALPFALSFVFGFVFRPFWPHLRNLLVSIFVMQGLFSVAAYGCRYHYLLQRRDDIYKSRLAAIKVNSFQHEFFDRNQDGLIEEIEFLTEIDVSAYPQGGYSLYTTASQLGELLPNGHIGYYDFSINNENDTKFSVIFKTNPQTFADYFINGSIDVNIGLQRILEVDGRGRQMLSFTRWSPFLRYTSWAGEDPEVLQQIIDLDYIPRIDSFTFLPLRNQ